MGQSDTSLERISSLFLERGLYVLRYESSTDAGDPPIAAVRQAEGCESTIQIISPPGAVAGELAAPGACVVVLAEAGGALHVSVRRRNIEGSLDAKLRLEPLAKENTPADARGRGATNGLRSQAPVRPAVTDVLFKVIGHVAHRGDVEVGQGEWIAGPDSPSPIEGIEVLSQPGALIEIEAQALISSNPPKWTNWALPGTFLGTRGRRLPLVGARLRVLGPDADQYEIVADALFLGSPIMAKRGREVELISSVAADPLVGLRLGVRRVNIPLVKSIEPAGERLREPRVRVFRATGSS